MIETVLNALVPIFFVIGLGYAAGLIRAIDNHHVAELNALVMEFALPAALFVATAVTPREKMLAEWSLFVLIGLAMMIPYAGWYLFQRRYRGLSRAEAAVQSLTVSLPNFAAAGLPIVMAVLGPSGTAHVAVTIAAGSILPSPVTLFILEMTRDSRDAASKRPTARLFDALRRALLKPIVVAPVAGIVISLSGVELSHLITGPLQLIGQTAGGVASFLTGLVLSAQPFKVDRRVMGGTLVANIVQPLLVLGLVQIIPTPPDIARVAILLAAVPSGFFGLLFGVTYGNASEEAGSMVIASTAFSMITLGAAIVLLYPT